MELRNSGNGFQSAIRNPQSTIRNLKSAIRRPGSESGNQEIRKGIPIRNPQSIPRSTRNTRKAGTAIRDRDHGTHGKHGRLTPQSTIRSELRAASLQPRASSPEPRASSLEPRAPSPFPNPQLTEGPDPVQRLAFGLAEVNRRAISALLSARLRSATATPASGNCRG